MSYVDHLLIQNRELQIMRIVRHPNIVELKAFYYSNGERVRLTSRETVQITDLPGFRKMRYTSTLSSSLCPRRSTEPQDTLTR